MFKSTMNMTLKIAVDERGGEPISLKNLLSMEELTNNFTTTLKWPLDDTLGRLWQDLCRDEVGPVWLIR